MGRLINDTRRRKPKPRFELDKADTPKKRMLTKMYIETQTSPRGDYVLNFDTLEDNYLTPSSHRLGMSPTHRSLEILTEETRIHEQIESNFEKYDRHKKMDILKHMKPKFQSQGSTLKLLSPKRLPALVAPPIGVYDLEKPQKMIEKKSVNCLILKEREKAYIKQAISQNVGKPAVQVKTNNSVSGERYEVEFHRLVSDIKRQRPGQKGMVSKEKEFAKNPFNSLRVETPHSDLMRFNQIMTSKFDDTRSRLHDLKLRLNEFGMHTHRDSR